MKVKKEKKDRKKHHFAYIEEKQNRKLNRDVMAISYVCKTKLDLNVTIGWYV